MRFDFLRTFISTSVVGVPQKGGGVPEQYDRLLGESRLLFLPGYECNSPVAPVYWGFPHNYCYAESFSRDIPDPPFAPPGPLLL